MTIYSHFIYFFCWYCDRIILWCTHYRHFQFSYQFIETGSGVNTWISSHIQVSGPPMVYGFCQGRTRFTTSHICNVYDFVESLSYELQPPTISFSTGNERTRFFLLWVQHTFSIVYPWWYMDVLSATELSLNRTRWFFIRYDSWGIS